MVFKNPVYYHLTNDQNTVDSKADLKKILDYLMTFAGDIGITEQKDGSSEVSYIETPLKANLKLSGKLNRQITLTCEKEDNVSVGLLKNITKDINYRIFNPQTLSYLVNDPGLLDLTTALVDEKILKIFDGLGLNPLFQYRDSLLFFASDIKGQIHLVNRHLLEYLRDNNDIKTPKSFFELTDFSVPIAKDIGRFVALMDRGLIPLSYYNAADNDIKVINLSGFNIDKLQRNISVEVITFLLDISRQSFAQNTSETLDIDKGKSLIKNIKVKNYLAIKIAQDVGYFSKDGVLIPKLKVLVFLDESV